jgi:serine/threonine protein kinase
LKPGTVFANNYLVQGELGSAAFSTAYRCVDLSSEEDEDGYQDEVCLKVIKNTKDYFDQSIDEIKILRLLKDTGRVQENNIVEMKSFFYHREHLVIVTELLRQNMYEFGKSIIESRGPPYFTRHRLSHITRQCLIALKFVHELGLMHCDIKPEVSHLN